MKPATAILSMLLILILAFCAFFYTGGTLKAQANCISANASEYAEAFEAVRTILASGNAAQRFSDETPADPAAYSLIDISIALSNRGIFAAEWLNIQLEGADGDIAVYSRAGDGSDIPARSTAQINLKLLTRAPANAQRTVSIQYYVFGLSRTIRVPI